MATAETQPQLLLDDRFLVQGLTRDRADVMLARDRLHALGVYGQVTVREYDAQQLPYADNLVNAIVSKNTTQVPRDELLRVLQPLRAWR